MLDISREDFLPVLQRVTGIVEKKYVLPILEFVLIETEGNLLRLTTTDGEIEVVANRALENPPESDMAFAVPAHKLLNICKSFSNDAIIQLDYNEENSKVVVKSGKSRFTLSSYSKMDFPCRLEEGLEEPNFEIPANFIKDALDRTSFAMAVNDARYYLNGVLFDAKNDGLNIVATDGHRLAWVKLPMALNIEESVQSIVPRKTALELNKRLVEAGSDNIAVYLNKKFIRFAMEGVVLTSKLIDGRYPDYVTVVPNLEHCGYRFNVPAQAFSQALKRAAIMTQEKFKTIRMAVESNLLKLIAQFEGEEAEESIDIEYDKENLEIGFNVSYLLDTINVIDTSEVEIAFRDVGSATLLIPNGESNYTYVVMPVRL
jgi:DNA polymerase-3 subunit beta